MPETVISVEQIDKQFGPYHVTGTVTRVWDPEAADRIRASMLAYILQRPLSKLLADAEQATAGGGDRT